MRALPLFGRKQLETIEKARLGSRICRPGALALFGVLAIHSGAQAQQPAPAEAAPSGPADATPAETAPAAAEPAAAPAEPAPAAAPANDYPPPPPPGYAQPGYTAPVGRPPTGYGAYPPAPPPSAYYPPAPPRGIHRPFTFAVGIGPGTLGSRENGKWNTDWGLAFDVRLGFGLGRNLMLQTGVDVTGASHRGFWYRQETLFLGLQAFLGRALYLRGAVGISDVSAEENGWIYGVSGPAMSTSGAIGLELIAAPSSSLAFEVGSTLAWYDTGAWGSTGFKIVFSFF